MVIMLNVSSKISRKILIETIVHIFCRTFCYPEGEPKLSIFTANGLVLQYITVTDFNNISICT